MKRLTERTLYLFVNCCVEKSRWNVAEQVVRTLKHEQFRAQRSIVDDMIVFDNGSTEPGTIEMLRWNLHGARFVRSCTNEGYWSAIDWTLNNYRTLLSREYEFIHIIESDHTYFNIHRLVEAEQALLANPDNMGSVRLQEYDCNDQSLYDKTLSRPDGRRYAWVSHVNHLGERIEIAREATANERAQISRIRTVDRDVWRSNFFTCLHSLNRISHMHVAFDELRHMNEFSEHKFQELYMRSVIDVAVQRKVTWIGNHLYTGILNGGIFHAKLGFTLDNPDVLSGSWSHDQESKGYKQTRIDRIRPFSDVEVIA